MSLNKAIKYGKEKRKEYRGSKAFDRSCRNGGTCPWCESGRRHFDRKRREYADSQISDWDDEVE